MPTDSEAVREMRFAARDGVEVRALGALPGAIQFSDEDEERGVPGICLVHEVFGLGSFMGSQVEAWANMGFAVLAPDLYSRESVGEVEGSPELPDPDGDWTGEQIRGALGRLSDRQVMADLDDALRDLGSWDGVDGDRLAVLGFCMGGNFAYLLGCHSDRAAAVVDFYGRIVYPELSAHRPVQPLEMALNLGVPFLGHFGEEDSSIPAAEVDRLESTLSQFAKSFDIVRYPGAGHGFMNDSRPAFHGPSAEAALGRTLEFLREEFE